MFVGRAIWSLDHVHHCLAMPCERKQVEEFLPLVAYRFSSGPWRTLWIRIGYDPRKDVGARELQGIDIRVPPSYRAVFGISEKRDQLASELPLRLHGDAEESPSTNVQPAISDTASSGGIDGSAVSQRVGGSTSSGSDAAKDFLKRVQFEVPPEKAITIYQLCDIADRSIDGLLRRTRPSASFDKRLGWFSSRDLGRIREIMNTTLSNWAKAIDDSIEVVHPNNTIADSDLDDDPEVHRGLPPPPNLSEAENATLHRVISDIREAYSNTGSDLYPDSEHEEEDDEDEDEADDDDEEGEDDEGEEEEGEDDGDL